MGASACNPFTSCITKPDAGTESDHLDENQPPSSSSGGGGCGGGGAPFQQNIIVMRHADRLDSAQPMWTAQASRPWDTPLTDAGKARAWGVGRRLRRSEIDFPIHRVFVSPFLRCLQTAAEVVRAMCALEDDDCLAARETSDGVVIDPARVKVYIEYGLCEVICGQTIHPNFAPKNRKWFPHNSELEAILPTGTIDHSVNAVRDRLPHWEESVENARHRYKKVILSLAQKFPKENLLLITHGEAVGVSISSFLKGMCVYDVNYCGYAHLQREVSSNTSRKCSTKAFKVLTENGQTGISYSNLGVD